MQVYVKDTLITSAATAPGGGSTATFDALLGNRNFGDTIYVAVGAGGFRDFDTFELAYTIEPIPEPSTLLLLGSGLAGGCMRWRRKIT